MAVLDWFGKPRKKTLDELIRGDATVTMADLLALDELQCRPEIVAAALRLLQDPKHSRDGYDILGPLAAEGDVQAQVIMGEFCEQALNRPEQAAAWFKRAAEQGHAGAERCYADMLMVGKGVPRDRKQAFIWYAKAAENGIPEAQFVLGEFYRVGTDVPKDIPKAIQWYERAMNSGFAPAAERLRQIKVGAGGRSS